MNTLGLDIAPGSTLQLLKIDCCRVNTPWPRIPPVQRTTDGMRGHGVLVVGDNQERGSAEESKEGLRVSKKVSDSDWFTYRRAG